jgi:hypothetical protein
MDDTIDRGEQGEFKGSQVENDNPPDWISTDRLETELFNAIVEDTSSARDGDSENGAEIEEDLGGDEEYEDDDERRRSALRVLATMRPQLAKLLGARPDK